MVLGGRLQMAQTATRCATQNREQVLSKKASQSLLACISRNLLSHVSACARTALGATRQFQAQSSKLAPVEPIG